MKIKVSQLEKSDVEKLNTVKEWLIRNGLPDVGSVHDSYLYQVGLDLTFNQATGKLDPQEP